MKKLLFLLLFFALGCVDQEIKPTVMENSNLRFKDTPGITPLSCPDPQMVEPKLFNMNGSYNGPTLDYLEFVTITWQSNDMFYPDNLVASYTLVIVVKNLSSHSIEYGREVGYKTLAAGGTKTYTWTGSCDQCYGPTCPSAVNGTFSFRVKSSSGSNYSCSTDMEVKLYTTDGYNIPTISGAQVYPYTFINQDC